MTFNFDALVFYFQKNCLWDALIKGLFSFYYPFLQALLICLGNPARSIICRGLSNLLYSLKLLINNFQVQLITFITIKPMSKNNSSNLDIDAITSSPFFKGSCNFMRQLATNWKPKMINKFPYTEFIINGDVFFKKLWKMIDESKDYFWITTYAIDSSPAADTTLLKLIEASKRGVNVVLFIDNVQYWPKQQLVTKFQNQGGRFLLLNPMFTKQTFKKIVSKQMWRRHHQKLIIADNKCLIGSANIEGNYAGIKYGNSLFQDLNYYTENIILDQYRSHFVDTANLYDFNLNIRIENQNLLEKYNKLHPNSQFYRTGKYKLLHNDPKNKKKQVQESILTRVENAQKQVKIIQPYHYPMIKFDRTIQKTAARNIPCTIITSGQRQQPVFRKIFNYMLFQRLILKGINVYETKERLLHSKVYLFDGKYLNLGSMNNDRWSWKINNEVNMEIQDYRDYQFVEDYFENVFKKCRKVTDNYMVSMSRSAIITFWKSFLYLSEIVMSKQGMPEESTVEELELIEQKENKRGLVI